ncbi:hypothetical protein ABFX02_04G060900 [Erythranthe guttata]
MAKTEGNSSGRNRPYYFRGCKGKKSSTNIDSLSDELVFDILLNLPAEDIYENAVLVCRRWSHMIRTRDFVKEHILHHSIPGLLILDYNREKKKNPSIFVAIRQGRIEISEFNYKMRGNILACCNGLILEFYISKHALVITNPATKQHFDVPRFGHPNCSSMAYSAVSMKYKVVLTYHHGGDVSTLRCVIATVGVDKSWRDVCLQHLSFEAKNYLYMNPITTGGFLHWTRRHTHTSVVTLNVETETITQYPVPQGQDYDRRYKYYLSTGKSLSLFISNGSFSMEVWEMKSDTGEWSEMCTVDLESRKNEFEKLRCDKCPTLFYLAPASWLKYPEVVVLRVSHPSCVCIAYNVTTDEIDFLNLGSNCNNYEFELHTKTLAWLN